MEFWKDIPGYDGKYQASSLGRVRNCKGRILRQSVDPKSKFVFVYLGEKRVLVQRRIAETFIPSNDKGLRLFHRDGDKTNNSIENLFWGYSQKNENLVGLIYGDFLVKKKLKRTNYKCVCVHCGYEKTQRADRLKKGQGVACSCQRSRWRQHSLYGVWSNMLARCYRPSSREYKYYGERGIRVCERWLKKDNKSREPGFWNFVKDMGLPPDEIEAGSKNKRRAWSLDRIDNNKGYSPQNCRWSNRQTQSENRRSVRPIKCVETDIIYKNAADAARQLGKRSGDIRDAIKGRQKTAFGYHWIYAD